MTRRGMSTDRSLRIAPSVLSADFGRLAEHIATVESAGAELLHLDVMDGHFVPNLSIGVPVVAGIRRHTRMFLDVHLMITDPVKYAPAFVKAGADNITFHIETVERPLKTVRMIRDLGVQVGVSLNPGTPAEDVLEVVEQVDMVLVMTVWPGFGGQEFIRATLGKIEYLSGRLRPDQRLEVDGGINVETVPLVVGAGADTLVAGSAVFGAADPGAAMVLLLKVAEETRARAEQTT